MCFNQIGDISILNGWSLKHVDGFTYLGSSVTFTENDINMRLAKTWTIIDRLSVIWKSNLSDEIKRTFFQAAVVSILLYGCTTWILTSAWRKSLTSIILEAILNKSWRQTLHKTADIWQRTTHHYNHPIRRTRHVRQCWRNKNELMSDVLLLTLSHRRARVGWPARTYLQKLCTDTRCSIEELPGAMDDREEWRERIREICACGLNSWWKLVASCSHLLSIKQPLQVTVDLECNANEKR